MLLLKFTPFDEMNIIMGLSFINHVPTSTKAWQISLAELQSLNLVLYNTSHHLILNIM